MSSWLPQVREVLARGGRPDKRGGTSRRSLFERTGPATHDTAETFPQEFGGLTMSSSGPGIGCARTPFELDPPEPAT
jgi:hypothetical protein